MKTIFLLFLASFVIIACEQQNENKIPTCIITAPVQGTEIQKGEILTIKVDAEDEDGEIDIVRIFVNESNFIGSASDLPFTFEWDTKDKTPETYIIKAIAIDNNGSSTDDEVSINIVSRTAPIADFSVNKSSISLGESISFTDLTENNPVNWAWDFGDRATSKEQNPTHTYNVLGSYTISLAVLNEYGSDTIIKTDYINVGDKEPGPIAIFSSNTTSIIEGESVDFIDESENEPTSWNWDFGDGENSTEQNPSHIYYSQGEYSVTLTVSNNNGDDTETKSNYIIVAENPADFVSPTIDGLADDIIWGNSNKFLINKSFIGENPTIESATWSGVWTDEGIYILVEATDDIWLPNWVTGLQAWESDYLELWFDTSDPQQDGLGGQDLNGNYSIGPNFSETQPGSVFEEPGYDNIFEGKGVIYAHTYNGLGKYIGEYYIPFEAIPTNNGDVIDPYTTTTIGFDVSIVDLDEISGSRSRIVWSNTGDLGENWLQMDNVGLITFENGGIISGKPQTK